MPSTISKVYRVFTECLQVIASVFTKCLHTVFSALRVFSKDARESLVYSVYYRVMPFC